MAPLFKEELPLHIDQNELTGIPVPKMMGLPLHILTQNLCRSLSPVFSRFAKAPIYSETDGVLYIYSAYTLIIELASGQLVQTDIAIHSPPTLVCGYVGTFGKAGQEAQVSVHGF